VRAVADTGPLVAAANRRERAHRLAAALVVEIGRDLVVPEPVLMEVDHLLRTRMGGYAARAFGSALVEGEHSVRFLTPALLRRAVELDEQFAELDAGLTDCSVMAIAERERLPILTFDFAHFRATRPKKGFWRLVVDERIYAEATS
jgi:predicted nucleic acid-binding protein